MTRRDDTRRDRSVAAVTRGPEFGRRLHFVGHHVSLPVILVEVLEATNTTVETFVARLQREAIWQDQSIQSADREVDIQAYLAPEGLRCVVRIGRNAFYHHPLGTFHIYGLLQPKIDIGDGVPLNSILRHELLDTIPIMVIGITSLNAVKPDLGICLRVTMPLIDVDVRVDRR